MGTLRSLKLAMLAGAVEARLKRAVLRFCGACDNKDRRSSSNEGIRSQSVGGSSFGESPKGKMIDRKGSRERVMMFQSFQLLGAARKWRRQ